MIVFGFADTLNECTATLSGDNPHAHDIVQEFIPERRAALQPVGGASGAYDFYDTAAWPSEPATVRVEFKVMDTTFAAAGARAQALVDKLKRKGQSKLWLIPRADYMTDERPVAPSFWKGAPTTGTIYGVTGIILSGDPPPGRAYRGIRVRALQGGRVVATTNASIITVGAAAFAVYTLTVPAGTYDVVFDWWNTQINYFVGLQLVDITRLNVNYFTKTQNSVVVTAGADTELDVSLTDGTDDEDVISAEQVLRMAFAKLRSAAVIESPADTVKNRVQVVAEFILPEGVLYNATLSVGFADEGDPTTFNLDTRGTAPAALYIRLLANVNPVTAFRLTNNDDASYVNFAGSVLATKYLTIDSVAYAVSNGGTSTTAGTADYANLSIGAGQVLWSYITPRLYQSIVHDGTAYDIGANSFTLAITQSTANYDLYISWWDTYAL
jgi:hypothetical protein